MKSNRIAIIALAGIALTLPAICSAQVNLICGMKVLNVGPQIAKKYGLKYIDQSVGGDFLLLQAANESVAASAQKKLAADPQVNWVEDDDNFDMPEEQGQQKGGPAKGSTLPAVGGRSVLYKGNKNLLQQIDWNQAKSVTSGRSVKLAILDTGLAPRQGYLWNNVVASVNYVELGKPAFDILMNEDSNQNNIPDEAVGHGTMIAGIVDQIAPNVQLVIARIADSDGNCTTWRLIKGLAYAVNNGAEVANVSLGSVNRLPAISDVLDWCDNHGLVVVCAAGNNGASQANFPAQYSKSIGVGGLMPDSSKAPFSNYDSQLMFSAPATGIFSQWFDGEIGLWAGTSFSTPMVAAAIADGLRFTVAQSPSTIRKKVTKVGMSLDSINPKYRGKLGYLLDVAALNKAISSGGN